MCEELAAAGSPLLLMVVSPAIVGTIINLYGTDDQKKRHLPGLADGTSTFAFSITEPDAGSNSHKIITTAYRSEDGWRLKGTKTYISGVDEASAVLVVARTEDARTGKLKPALFLVPTDSVGFTYQEIDMGIVSPEKQFTLFFDDVLVPEDALIGSQDAGIEQLFAGLNPERIMAASFALGTARLALAKASEYAKIRQVWDVPIGAHQAISHPLAVCNAVDRAIQTHGGNGLANEYGLVQMLAGSRLSRIAPVSREMALNFVAQFSLGLPKSY